MGQITTIKHTNRPFILFYSTILNIVKENEKIRQNIYVYLIVDLF